MRSAKASEDKDYTVKKWLLHYSTCFMLGTQHNLRIAVRRRMKSFVLHLALSLLLVCLPTAAQQVVTQMDVRNSIAECSKQLVPVPQTQDLNDIDEQKKLIDACLVLPASIHAQLNRDFADCLPSASAASAAPKAIDEQKCRQTNHDATLSSYEARIFSLRTFSRKRRLKLFPQTQLSIWKIAERHCLTKLRA